MPSDLTTTCLGSAGAAIEAEEAGKVIAAARAERDRLALLLVEAQVELDAARAALAVAEGERDRLRDSSFARLREAAGWTPPLRWTTEPPTSPGPYFCRGPSQFRDHAGTIDTEVGMVRRTAAPGVMRFDSEWLSGTIGASASDECGDHSLDDGRYQWAGPLPLPVEPEAPAARTREGG